MAAGLRTRRSLPRLVAGECGPELSEGGQAIPTSSDGFWPQQVLGGDGQQGVEEGKQHPLIKVGTREALNSSPAANFRGRGGLQSKLWPRVGVEEWGPWLGWGIT